VDVSQLIDLRSGDGARLRALARTRGALADERSRARWQRIDRFAEACERGEVPVNAIWLEYDLDRGLGPSTVPSVFANLSNTGPADWRTLYAVLSRLGARGGADLQESLARCTEGAERFGGRARGLCGVMLARNDESRIMVLGIPAEAVADYLQHIGWGGDVEQVVRVTASLWVGGGDSGLSLELAPSPRARVGVELRLDDSPDHASVRRRTLDDLVASGLCSARKRKALEEWSGQDTPVSAQTEWPEALLVASMLRPADQLGVFYRMLHHVKVAAGGPHPPTAKAYLGFLHSWWKPTATGYRHVV
jgi:hypothetical protein